MAKIFFSHSSKDKVQAREIVERIRTELNNEVDIFLSTLPNAIPGGDWQGQLFRELEEADALALLLTPDSILSTWVIFEYSYFLGRHHENIDRVYMLRNEHMTEIPEPLDIVMAKSIEDEDEMAVIYERMREQFGIGASSGESVSDIIGEPFEWINIPAGVVILELGEWKGTEYELSKRRAVSVESFSISKYPITNLQYDAFLKATDGYVIEEWWDYSYAAQQWRTENDVWHEPTFLGDDLPRTNVSWFEGICSGDRSSH